MSFSDYWHTKYDEYAAQDGSSSLAGKTAVHLWWIVFGYCTYEKEILYNVVLM